MWNPQPRIEAVPIGEGRTCFVIDDALREPERLRAFAIEHRARFAMAPHNAFPGLELRMPPAFDAALDAFFALHLRARLGARRTLKMYSRLSMVTLPPERLAPAQSICHRDRLQTADGQRVAASVLYLFDDAALGGTAFYRPLRSALETEALVQASVALPADAFAARFGIEPGYIAAGNAWFERIAAVPARWNRLIVYDGDAFHSGDIASPARLTDDPASGRLTLNGFFTCSRAFGA